MGMSLFFMQSRFSNQQIQKILRFVPVRMKFSFARSKMEIANGKIHHLGREPQSLKVVLLSTSESNYMYFFFTR